MYHVWILKLVQLGASNFRLYPSIKTAMTTLMWGQPLCHEDWPLVSCVWHLALVALKVGLMLDLSHGSPPLNQAGLSICLAQNKFAHLWTEAPQPCCGCCSTTHYFYCKRGDTEFIGMTGQKSLIHVTDTKS